MKILICDKLDKITIEELQKLGTCIDVSQDKDKSKKIIENIIDAEIVLPAFTALSLIVAKSGINPIYQKTRETEK